MSRIGRLPIIIPENVDISYSGSEITVKGKFGTLQTIIPETIEIENENGILTVSLKNKDPDSAIKLPRYVLANVLFLLFSIHSIKSNIGFL